MEKVFFYGQMEEDMKDLFQEIECMEQESGTKQMDQLEGVNGNMVKEWLGQRS